MNKFLKHARKSAHEEFDRLWRSKLMTRSEAYEWLASKLNISMKKCHMKNLNESQCFDVERISFRKYKKLMRHNAANKIVLRMATPPQTITLTVN